MKPKGKQMTDVKINRESVECAIRWHYMDAKTVAGYGPWVTWDDYKRLLDAKEAAEAALKAQAEHVAVVKPLGKLFFDADGDICHDQGGFNLVACPAYDYDGIDTKQLNPEYVIAMVDAFNASSNADEVSAKAKQEERKRCHEIALNYAERSPSLGKAYARQIAAAIMENEHG